MLTNLLPGNDETMFYFNLGGTRSFGRWGLYALQMDLPFLDTSIIARYGMPWVKGSISIILLAIVACLIVYLFEIQKNILCILTGAIIVTYPSVAATFSYMFTSSSYFIGLLLGCLAVCIAKRIWNGKITLKCVWGGGLASCILMLSLSIYQAYFCVAIGLFVSDLILQCLRKNVKFASVFKCCFFYLAVIILGLVFYYISIQIMLAYFWPTLSSYQGIGDLATGGIGNMIKVVFFGTERAYKSFFDVPFLISETLKIRRIFYLVIGVTALIQVAVLAWEGGIYKSIKAGLLIVLLSIYPLAVNSVYLMGSTGVSSLMMYCTAVPLLLELVFLQRVVEETVLAQKIHIKKLIYSFPIICVIFLSYQHYLISNECYNRQYFTYEQTYGYMNRVAYAIQSCEGYNSDTPVMLSGKIEKEVTMPEFDKLNYITGIFGESDLINGYSREEFIRRYCGLPIKKADEELRDQVVASSEFVEMPIYPDKNSVKIINGCLVVKFE